MNREAVLNNFKQNIRDMTLEQFAGLFINKVMAVEDFYKLTVGINAGKTISLLFNPHRLDTVTEASVERTSAPMSIYASLSDKGNDKYTEKLDGLARLYLYNLEHGVNNPFYCAVQRGYNGVAYVNEFPPFVAQTIYKTYANPSKGLRVLDPCCGWGGRMIGCASIPNTTYVGCEPCTATYNGLVKLGEWLQTLQPTFKFEIHNIPYEDFICEDKFDIALTSPPYYNTEKYSDEMTNSLNRYADFDSWVGGFYTPLITDTIQRLDADGVFVINVGDRKYPLSENLIRICNEHGFVCERIHDYLSGNGEGKEKFYCISTGGKAKKKARSLF